MASMPPPGFQRLFEVPRLPRFDLPEALEATYGGFGLPAPVVYANFVTSLDGVAAVPEVPRSSALISGGNPADRFVVALLRACADVIVIGAGTLRAHAGPWTAEKAYPSEMAAFAELRRRLGMSGEPPLVVVTGSGRLDGESSKLRGAIVATTARAAERARESAGRAAEVVAIDPLDVREIVTMLSGRGHERILTEGGPKLMGQLLEAALVDELFLTVSPIVTGGGERQRPTLAASVDLLPAGPSSARLLSVHRHGSYLFLRYGLLREEARGPDMHRGESERRRRIFPGSEARRDEASQ
jgi:riboflavin biosynthesis pyrimidine reductase